MTCYLRMALIANQFDDWPEDQQLHLLSRLLRSGECKLYRPAVLGQVMLHLRDGPDARQFQDLAEKVNVAEVQEYVMSRFPASREKASRFTPSAIKALRPDRPGVYLVWQVAADIFEAYYPKPQPATENAEVLPGDDPEAAADSQPAKRRRVKSPAPKSRLKTHITRSKQYGTIRTPLEALWQCVNFLWTEHAKAKHAARCHQTC